ncbi:MAG: PQQ-binding-like beta-propeller repeat protein [Bryobacteraceae bacterium]
MRALVFVLLFGSWAAAQEPCKVTSLTASLAIPFVAGAPELNVDPQSSTWRNAARATIVHDCSRNLDYPAISTDVRAFWTSTDVWFLFACPYKDLNLFLPAQGGGPRLKLWDRDVVELFLGDDWDRIRHYREFEIAPTGDWIDLAIDLDHENYDSNWRSNWKTAARIDEATHTWYAAARIPLKSVSEKPVTPGSRWRMNLYRIEGLGEDPQRHFLCWQPTCVQNRDPNHVPENFGSLVFAGATADPVAAGRKRFEIRCAACHGADGAGGELARGVGSVDRSRLQTDQAVKDLIRHGLPESGMPAFPLPDAELDLLVAFVRSRVAPANQTIVAGDAVVGEKFFHGEGGCAQCHMVQGSGGFIGPDLSRAGQRLTVAELETALRKPDTRRVRGYQVASLKLKDGTTLRGLLKNESGFDYQLMGLDGHLHLLPAAQVAAVTREPNSLMRPVHAPEKTVQGLLAYLATLPAAGTKAGLAPELPGAVSWDKIRQPDEGQWPTYHGTLGGNRHSPLKQITAKNVESLSLRWAFPVPNGRGLEMTPVVAGGVMYATAVNSVYALDAGTGREIWSYSRPRSTGLVGDASGGINRGVAVLGDRVFLVTDNAHLLALHRVTGSLLWDIEMADSGKHYGSTSAPIVVKDLVVAGVSGGDEGIRGFVSAYRATTGERVWRFWTIPAPGEPLAATSWIGRALEHGCGATWLSGTYDTETNLLFWPTGNPCPDFNGDERKGDNLYTDSVLALNPETGELKWHYQFTPHDLHDWDATETPMVVDATWGGRPRKLLLQGNRNGFFYVLDRTTGEFLNATPFVKRLTWATSIGKDGRPNLAAGWQPTEEGTKVCPSMDGATNWMSTAFNPDTGLFYLMALEKCNVFSKSPEWWKQGESFYGGSAWEAKDETPQKYLRALDIQTGKIVWERPQTGPGEGWGGILTTASGLLFYADESGALAAADAKTGLPLWHVQLNAKWKASPMTFTAGGQQMVAIAAGSTVLAFALPEKGSDAFNSRH